MRSRNLLLAWLVLLLVTLPAPTGLSQGSSPPKRSSSAITITADGGTLLVVNPDSNSLTLVDTASHAAIIELAAGTDPRTVAVDDAGQRAYVANRGSDSVSVVDLETRTVIADVAIGHRPYGIVVDPAGEWVYVAEQGTARVRVLDTEGFETRAVLPVGERPSGLALSQDAQTLYVTHLLTNTVTVLKPLLAIVYLPLIVKGEAANSQPAALPNGKPAAGWPGARNGIHRSSSVRLWPDSNLAQSIVIAPDGLRAYIPHTRSNTANRALTFDTTVFPIVSLIDLATQEHLVGQQLSLDTIDPPGVGLPYDAALTPDGGEIWVLNAASNDITVVDLGSRRRVAHIEVSDNPRGIVLSPDGHTAYVNNTLAGTVSVLDTATYTVTDVITTTHIPLPPVLLNGKRLFHSSDDGRMARAQWISCNTCHFEGEQDGRIWFFGFAGPRNTTSLLGMIETYPLRWSGEWNESADAEFANRKENFGSGLLEGNMNCALSPPDCVHQPPNQGRSYDLDCLAAFIDSLRVPLSPGHAHGEPLNETERRGQAIFLRPDLGCVGCHPPPLYTDLLPHNVGTVTEDERIGPAYDTPTLRGLYGSAPHFHDGSAATLYDALTRPSPGSEHDVRGLLSETEIADLIAFLKALPFEE